MESSNQKPIPHFVTTVHAGLKASEIAMLHAQRSNAMAMEHGKRHADMLHGHWAALAEVHDPGQVFKHLYEHVQEASAHAAEVVKDFLALGHSLQQELAQFANSHLAQKQDEFKHLMGGAQGFSPIGSQVAVAAVKNTQHDKRSSSGRSRQSARKTYGSMRQTPQSTRSKVASKVATRR